MLEMICNNLSFIIRINLMMVKIYVIINTQLIYCFNLLMIIPTLQKNTITENNLYLTLVCSDIPIIDM